MIVTYTEKGKEFDFRRVDRVRAVRGLSGLYLLCLCSGMSPGV